MRKRFLAMGLMVVAGLSPVPAPGMLAAAAEESAPPVVDPAAGVGDSALLERIAGVARAMTTMQGAFVKRTYNPSMPDEPAVTKGKFAIAVPDKYNLVETKPDEPDYRKRTCSDGTTIAEIEAVSSDQEPDRRSRAVGDADVELRRVLACVRGDFSQLKGDFTIVAAVAAKPEDGSTVTLTPTNADVAHDISRIQIHLDAASHVSGLEVDQPSGTRIVVQVDSAEYEQPIPAETFTMPRE